MRSAPLTLFAITGLALAACNSVSSPAQSNEVRTDVTAYTEASVFDGEAFVARTICVADRVLVDCPARSGSTVSLAGQYITPPIGDAHTHHFDGPFTLDWHISIGLRTGAFYAMNMTASTSEVVRIRDRLSGPGNIDVASSLGGVTGPDSHPAEIYEALALGLRSYEQQLANQDAIRASRRAADNAYYVVETPEDVEAKLALLLEHDPDHVKVFLRQSERYAEGWGKWGPGGGVDPDLLPQIAELAVRANKRLAIATSSVSDFREALEVGAFNATHAPCYQETDGDPDSPYYDVPLPEDCLLSEADAELAAQNGMSTTFIVTEWSKDRPQKYLDWEQQNISHLRDAGADMVVGSNAYGSGMTEGLIAGVEKGIFDASELLKIATMTTPKVIFPDRAVGCLEIGCEASFIAFADNPIDDVTTLRELTFRLKDGEVIELAAAE